MNGALSTRLPASGIARITEMSRSDVDQILAIAENLKLRQRIEKGSIPEPNSGCWLWFGPVNDWGYGRIWFEGALRRAHRVSYVVHKGAIGRGLCVCHKCDVPSCVNPDHLFLGTFGENNKDRKKKGRGGAARGEDSTRSRLTTEQAKVAKYSSESARSLAERFGVSSSLIFKIRTGVVWRHI